MAKEPDLPKFRAFQASSGHLSVGEIKDLLGTAVGATSLVGGLMCQGLLTLPLAQRITDDTVATYFERSSSRTRGKSAHANPGFLHMR